MKSHLKKIVFVFTATLFIIVFHSCNKEWSYEGGTSPFAQGTLKDFSGDSIVCILLQPALFITELPHLLIPII